MLKGTHVQLGPLKKEYIPTFLKWFNDPEITQFLDVHVPMTFEAELEWFNNASKQQNPIIFLIYLHELDQPRLIGNCAIDISQMNRVGTLGIVIGEKDCWGKGYGTEALKILIEYGFNTLNLHRVELETYGFNERAFKSYLKVGFREEGRRREAIFANGAYHDAIMLGLLRSEWNSSKS